MKYSKLFFPIKKNVLEKDSLGFYLIKYGFVDRVSSGIYTYLPICNKYIEKIKKIILSEMDKLFANNVQFSTLQPSLYLEKSLRDNKFSNELFFLNDKKRNFYLSPTNEESSVILAKKFVNSYKDLPLIFYQINNKYRNEIRTKNTLLRTKEFIMKDAYSFDIDEESFYKTFLLIKESYIKIFNKLDIDFLISTAASGSMGGEMSYEFHALCPNGDNKIIECSKSNFNIEKIKCYDMELINKIKLVDNLKIEKKECDINEKCINNNYELISNFIVNIFFYKTENNYINVYIYNSKHELNFYKIDSYNIKMVENSENHFYNFFYKRSNKYINIIIDDNLKNLKYLFYKLNNKIFVINDEFFDINEYIISYQNIKFPSIGDINENGEKINKITNGFEIAHIFDLGDVYTKAFNFALNNKDSKKVYLKMGSYGIGVSRLLMALIEQKRKEKNLLINKYLEPYDIAIIPIFKNIKDDNFGLAEDLYNKLVSQNIDCILYDVKKNIGNALYNLEAIGVKNFLIIGKKYPLVEFIDKRNNKNTIINSNDIIKYLLKY